MNSVKLGMGHTCICQEGRVWEHPEITQSRQRVACIKAGEAHQDRVTWGLGSHLGHLFWCLRSKVKLKINVDVWSKITWCHSKRWLLPLRGAPRGKRRLRAAGGVEMGGPGGTDVPWRTGVQLPRHMTKKLLLCKMECFPGDGSVGKADIEICVKCESQRDLPGDWSQWPWDAGESRDVASPGWKKSSPPGSI